MKRLVVCPECGAGLTWKAIPRTAGYVDAQSLGRPRGAKGLDIPPDFGHFCPEHGQVKAKVSEIPDWWDREGFTLPEIPDRLGTFRWGRDTGHDGVVRRESPVFWAFHTTPIPVPETDPGDLVAWAEKTLDEAVDEGAFE